MVRLPAPRMIDPNAVPALKWGVVGTGISSRFANAIHKHTEQRVVAVTARDAAKTEHFAAEHGVARVHASVPDLVSDPAVDVVYVATPHPAHFEVAMTAIAAGKHVLVEKPIAMSSLEAHAITGAGRVAGVLVMEGMWTRYLPQADIIRQVVESRALGDVRLVQADFGFAPPFNPEHRLWNPALGGGALRDAGVYPISFASSVLGAPRSVVASGRLSTTGVDASANLLLTTSDGSQAVLSASIETSMPTEATIMGSAGYLRVHSPFWGPSGLTIAAGRVGQMQSETWIDKSMPALHDGLSYEATAFASYVGEGRLESPVHPHAEIVSVMATIDTACHQVVNAK